MKNNDSRPPLDAHYFSNKKAWVSNELLFKVLKLYDRKMKLQNRNVFLISRQCNLSPRVESENLKWHQVRVSS